ncbi:MAG: M48 family metallopeptidase [Deltaproteobacteria bacterium]|nr:M48 family metallopeptidase [Deltaproteobacteria bacterium]
MTKPYQVFPDISSINFEHSSDRAALNALRKIPGIDLLIKKIFGFLRDKPLRLIFLASAVRINENQRPDLYEELKKACEILDCPVPELYLIQDARINAMAVGIEKPFIVINTALLDRLVGDEIRTVLAHELGHIISGHSLYKTINWILQWILTGFFPSLFQFATLPLVLALKEWDRKSELSADRAGLLASQDLEVSLTVLFKLAGAMEKSKFNLEEFEMQAKEYQESGDLGDSFFKILNLIFLSHPFLVLRISELRKWHDSGDYSKIKSGNYIRRSEESQTKVKDDFMKSYEEYKNNFKSSQDPLVNLAKEIYSFGESFISEALRKKG